MGLQSDNIHFSPGFVEVVRCGEVALLPAGDQRRTLRVWESPPIVRDACVDEQDLRCGVESAQGAGKVESEGFGVSVAAAARADQSDLSNIW